MLKKDFDIFVLDIMGVLMHSEGICKDMVSFSKNMKNKGKYVYLASNLNKETARYLWKDEKWETLFDGLFASSFIGFSKPARGFFLHIDAKVAIEDPTKVLFIDDSLTNVKAAETLGWKGYYYTTYEKFEKDVT